MPTTHIAANARIATAVHIAFVVAVTPDAALAACPPSDIAFLPPTPTEKSIPQVDKDRDVLSTKNLATVAPGTISVIVGSSMARSRPFLHIATGQAGRYAVRSGSCFRGENSAWVREPKGCLTEAHRAIAMTPMLKLDHTG